MLCLTGDWYRHNRAQMIDAQIGLQIARLTALYASALIMRTHARCPVENYAATHFPCSVMACVNCRYRVPVATAGAPPSLMPTAAMCVESTVTPGSVDTHSRAACRSQAAACHVGLCRVYMRRWQGRQQAKC